MKTDYAAHDDLYRQRREKGWLGWHDEAEDYDAQRELLTSVFRGGLSPNEGMLLELGCGAGNLTLHLSRLGFEVSAIDLSPAAVDWARERAHVAQVPAVFYTMDALTLPGFSGETFDAAYDSHCLHCIIGADRAKLLASVHRVLKPGGYFLIDTMCWNERTEDEFVGFDSHSGNVAFNDQYVRYVGRDCAIELEIAAAGFEILSRAVRLQPEEPCDMLMLECRKS